jgi:hypothetical protein
LLVRSFQDFFTAHIRKYENYQTTGIGFIGSIAYSYRELLTRVAQSEKVEIIRILPSPADGLIEFHQMH